MGTAIFTDSSTTLAHANFRKLLAADGTDGNNNKGAACIGLWIRYDGASWEARAAKGAIAQTSNVGLTWDGVNERLEIDLSGCDNTFGEHTIAVVSAAATDSFFIPKAESANADTIYVRFYDVATGARETTETTDMSFNIIIWGEL
jgi:hypothetical protein